MLQTLITFPEIELTPRYGHKLRGFFGNYFQEHSPLLHNHLEGTDKYRYAYPLVQYKVVEKRPMLVGFNEGAQLLVELFLKIDQLELEGLTIPVHQKNIQSKKLTAGYADDLFEYEFKTLWMALNQDNYTQWKNLNQQNRKDFLKPLLVNHIIAALRGVDCGPPKEKRLMCALQTEERRTNFKNNIMTAFTGSFTINADLPDYMGIGKSVSRGFGTILKKK